MAEETTLKNHQQDIIIVRNPTNRPFTFTWDSIPHTVGAQEEKPYPRFLAVHYAKKMIVTIINSRIKKVKIGNVVTDSLKTSDTNLQKKLASYLLIKVAQRWQEPPKPKKKIVSGKGFELDEYDVPDKERKDVKVKIDLPETMEEEIFSGIEVIKPEAPKSPVKVEKEKNAPTPKSSEKTSQKPKFSRQDLLDECGTLQIEVSGKETVEELEGKILAQAT